MWGKEKHKPSGAGQSSRQKLPAPAIAGGIESTIGPNTHVKGNVQGDGGLRVEGIIEGTIELTGNLIISESGKIRAEIKANNVSIAGVVLGNISANRVEILDTGRVWGDLTVKSLLINEGAYLHGQTIMPQDLQPPKFDPPKTHHTPPPRPATPPKTKPKPPANSGNGGNGGKDKK
jgi:cytoskeletal protein CcmA (bactofilin family)